MEPNDLRFVGIVASAVVAIFFSFVSCTMHIDAKISQDIANGADPTAAYCAHSSSPDVARCAIIAAKEQK